MKRGIRPRGLVLSIRHVRVEVYNYDVPGYGRIRWDVTQALAEVAAGHVMKPTPEPLPTSELENIQTRCEWNEDHIAEVDPSIPGIAAPFLWQGQVTWVPIDGIHRVIRALRDGVGFSMWLLTEEAGRACVIDGPLELIP